MKKLADYHAKNKYLYFAYKQTLKNKLGLIVANHEKLETPNCNNKLNTRRTFMQ